MNPWSKKRVFGLCGLVCAYGLAVTLIALLCDTASQFLWLGMLSYTTFVLAAIALFKPPTRTLLTVLLASLIIAAPIHRARALVPECAIALVVLGVGVVCYFGLKSMCKNLPPTEAPPPPPSPKCTNCNPAHPDWPCTNCPPLKGVELKSLVWNDGSSIVVNMSDDAVFAGQITNTLTETDPYGYPYTKLFSFRMDTSENLTEWNTLSATGWLSQAAMIAVIYAGDGKPVSTNWSQIENGGTTNVVGAPIHRREKQFFLVK